MSATDQARAAFEARLDAAKLFGTTETAQRGITPAQRAQDQMRNELHRRAASQYRKQFTGEQITGWSAL